VGPGEARPNVAIRREQLASPTDQKGGLYAAWVDSGRRLTLWVTRAGRWPPTHSERVAQPAAPLHGTTPGKPGRGVARLEKMVCHSPASTRRPSSASASSLHRYSQSLEENSILERSVLVEWDLTHSIVGLGPEPEVYGRLLDVINDHGNLSFSTASSLDFTRLQRGLDPPVSPGQYVQAR
jgi:hypothetical protein